MKIKKLPSVLVLLVFSWLISIFGVCLGVYLFVSMPDKSKPPLIPLAVILAGILLSALIRVFADLGQMIFDLKFEVQLISKYLNQRLTDMDTHLVAFFAQAERMLESLNEGLIRGSLDTNRALKGINDNIGRFDLDVKSGMVSLNEVLTRLNGDALQMLEELKDLLSQSQYDAREGVSTLRASLDKIDWGLGQTRDALNKSFMGAQDNLQKAIQEQCAVLLKNLDLLRSVTECINCDSKDVNQNISKIKIFFEQIEQHLNLNK